MKHTKNTKSVFARMVSFALAACMVFSIITVTAGAEETDAKNYVALGDSISTGYGLAEGEKAFTQLVAEQNSFNLTSLAEDGATTASLLAKLSEAETVAALSTADVVTITIGGNDFVGAFFEYVARSYNEANEGANKTAEDIKNDILGNNFIVLNFALGIAEDFDSSTECQTAIVGVQKNFPQIIAAIKSINPQTAIILTNQYNPYSFAAGTLTGTDEYTLKFKALEGALDSGIQTINSLVTVLCTQLGCSVADAYTALKAAEENPTNAVFSLSGLSLDFHPNAYGHSLIANAVSAVIPNEPEYTKGDVDMNGVIDTNDVTMIQMYVVGADLGDTFNISLADLNDDGEISITDATLLQMFISQMINI